MAVSNNNGHEAMVSLKAVSLKLQLIWKGNGN